MKNRGYTLIELLISMTILMLFMGAGVAAFLSFNTKQQVAEAARGVAELMRTAQIKASAGDIPTGCTQISSYRVSVTAGGSSATLSAVCTIPNLVVSVSTFQFTGGVTAITTAQNDFKVLRGGVNPGGIVYFQSTPGRVPYFRYQFKVSTAGSISEGFFY